MARITGWLAAVLLLVSSVAVAQEAGRAGAGRPRAELGVGGGIFSNGGSMLWVTKTLEARASLRLTSGLSVEGVIDFSPETDFNQGVYRVQGQWRIGHYPYQPFITFGGGGQFNRYLGPPMYPTAGVGVEKLLASHLAIRAELAVAFGLSDYGIATAFLPSASVSIPIGRYRR